MSKKLFSLLGLVIIVFLLSVLIAPFTSPSKEFFYSGEKKWAHKGYGQYNSYNSHNFKKAAKSGYQGIEFDVVYLENKIYVRHDIDSLQNALLLEKLLDSINNMDLFYWVDMKAGFSRHPHRSVTILKNTFSKNQMVKEKSIFETKNISVLRQLKKHNFHTTYGINPLDITKPFSFFKALLKNSYIISFLKPDAISLSSKNYNFFVEWLYKKQQKLIWLENPRTSQNSEQFFSDETVKIILE